VLHLKGDGDLEDGVRQVIRFASAGA
jgi:hypothetical protein